MIRAPLYRPVGRVFFVLFTYAAFICMATIVRLLTEHAAWVSYLWGIPAAVISAHLWGNLYPPNAKADGAKLPSSDLLGADVQPEGKP
jgi:hypothetical protein